MKNRGFTIVEAVLVIVVVGIITTLGFVAYNQFVKPKTIQTSSATETSVTTVNSSADLDTVASDLDAIDLSDKNDTMTLDTQTANF